MIWIFFARIIIAAATRRSDAVGNLVGFGVCFSIAQITGAAVLTGNLATATVEADRRIIIGVWILCFISIR
jgi:hypothetical protein